MSIPDQLVSKARYLKDKKLQLFLDYDGTLVPIQMDPDNCYPDDELMEILKELSGKYDLYIITGRSMEDITRFLGYDFNIIALHGALKLVGGKISENVKTLDYCRQVCDRIYSNRKLFEEQFEGLRMYNKNGNLTFHLGLIQEPEQREMISDLVKKMGSENMMDVYQGKMIVELRIPGINKGKAIKEVRNGSDAIIAGDDHTDEEAFRVNSDAIRIKVGRGPTFADYSLEDYQEMREFLKIL